MTIILYVIVFAAIFLWMIILLTVLFGSRVKIEERLKNNVTRTGIQQIYDREEEQVSIKQRVLGILSMFTSAVYRKSYMERKKSKLEQAAILMKPEEFVAMSILIGTIAFIFVFYVSGQILVGIIMYYVGFKFPDLLLKGIRDRRMKKMKAQLPDALSVISNGLKAGFSFAQALGIAAKEMDTPISDEFERVIRENSLGKPLEETLQEMVRRTEDEDMDLFVTAIVIQRQVGGNLSEILDTISFTIRDRIRLVGQIRTMTAEGKFTATVISILPIALATVIMMVNPAYMATLYQTQMGIILIAVAVGLELIGIFLIMKIVSINI